LTCYLEVTYRQGRPLAAYLYLSKVGQKSYRTQEAESGLLVDYSRRGKPIGIEITAPEKVTGAKLNRLQAFRVAGAEARCLSPLRAA
jgi:uncharacterized protein YuzE